MALGLKEALQNDKSVFDADRLQKITGNFASPWTWCLFLYRHIFLHVYTKAIFLSMKLDKKGEKPWIKVLKQGLVCKKWVLSYARLCWQTYTTKDYCGISNSECDLSLPQSRHQFYNFLIRAADKKLSSISWLSY